MHDPKDMTVAHLIVAGIDLTRTLASIGKDVQGKDLQEVWTKLSAVNNGVLPLDEYKTKQLVRMACSAMKMALDTISKHYGE